MSIGLPPKEDRVMLVERKGTGTQPLLRIRPRIKRKERKAVKKSAELKRQ